MTLKYTVTSTQIKQASYMMHQTLILDKRVVSALQTLASELHKKFVGIDCTKLVQLKKVLPHDLARQAKSACNSQIMIFPATKNSIVIELIVSMVLDLAGNRTIGDGRNTITLDDCNVAIGETPDLSFVGKL